MRIPPADTILPGIFAVAGIVILVFWTQTGTIQDLEARVPGLDRPPQADGDATAALPLVGKLTKSDGQPADLPGVWPHFRGGKYDGIVDDGVALARSWPKEGPKQLWSIELGEGHAGAAVRGGKVYVLDYDREAEADVMRCLSLADGKQIWQYSYPVVIKRNHGMSRTVPAVTDKLLVGLGPKCHVSCLNPESGESFWLMDMVAQHGATVPPWYAGQCPMVDGDRVILATGGKALLIAVDGSSGDVIWESPNPRGWRQTHVSIMPMELAGRKMYVYCGHGGVAGIAADDGSLLWDTTDWKISIATVPSPTIIGDGRIFFSGGYNAGAVMIRVKEEGGKFAAETLFRLKPKQFGSTQQTPILLDGYLYGVREKDKQFVCLDLEGKEVWKSGSRHKFGLGPYTIADGLIYVMDDHGLLTMAEATPDGFKMLAQAQVLDGHDAWGPMALVAGRLILRDLTKMVCLDVSKK